MAISTAIDASAVARVLGIKTNFVNLRRGAQFLPQRIAVVGQGNTAATYATTKQQVNTALEVANAYGYGSPLHLAAEALLPLNGDGVGSVPVTVYPLEDAASGVAAVGDITPTVAQTTAAAYRVRINNIDSEEFVIDAGAAITDVVTDMAAAINAVLKMPVTATAVTTATEEEVTLTAKWKGASGNDIHVEVIGPTTAGTTFAITQPTGGLVNPDVQGALDQIGNVWETLVLNCLDIADTTALDAYSTFGEGRWGALVNQPLMVFTGNTAATVNGATAISDARKTDRVNAQLVAPGSNDLPLVVAGRQLTRIARTANNNPPQDYCLQAVPGITPGADGDQWLFTQRDSAIKKGSSTVEVIDGVVNMSDTVTFYHPSGDPLPAYRYVVDIIKLQNAIYNYRLKFATADWAGAPLIPDNQPTVNRTAKKPKMAVAAAAGVTDALGAEAIISDPETAKGTIVAAINAQNPKRLDLAVTIQLSGNTNIISMDLNFGFFFGG